MNEYRNGTDMLLEEKDDRLKVIRAEVKKLRKEKTQLLTALSLAKEARKQFDRYGFYGQKQINGIFEPMDLAIQECKGIE